MSGSPRAAAGGGPLAASPAGRAGCFWLGLVLACTAVVYFPTSCTDQLGALGNDGPNYLMMAQHYSPYHGADAVYAQAAAVSRFPPLYPLLLAWTGAETSLPRVHALTTACLLAALGALYIWWRRYGAGAPMAAAQVLLLAALPGTWLLGLSVQSEYLYLFLSLLALALLSVHARDRQDQWLYCAALAVAAATLTRAVGLALYLPLLLAALRSRPRAALLALTAALLPLLLWHLLHRAEVGYADVLGGTYGDGLWDGLRRQVAEELPALVSGFEGNFLAYAGAARPAADILGALCLIAALRRAAARAPDALYILAYGALLLPWPYPDDARRFLWVVLPVLLAQPLLWLAEARPTGANRADWPRHAPAVALLLVLGLELPGIAWAADRYRLAQYTAVPQARAMTVWYGADPLPPAIHRAFSELVIADALRRIPEEIGADQCVIAIRTDLVNYYSRRRSAFPPLNDAPDPLFQALLHASGCRYVFMSTATTGKTLPPLHPLQRLGDRLRVLDYVDTPDPPPGPARVRCILAELD